MNTVSIESFLETQDNVAKIVLNCCCLKVGRQKAVVAVTPTDEFID